MSFLRPLALLALLPAAAASPAALTPLRGGPFEASGVAAVPGAGGVLLVDDGRPGDVLWLPIAADGSAGDVRPVATGVAVADPEGITTDGTWIYVVGSLSRGTGASLARFRFDAASHAASAAESMAGLEDLLRAALPELGSPSTGKKKKDPAAQLNIEGLAWDPKGSRLLLGIRSPVVGGSALAVPLRLKDPAGPLADGNVVVEVPLRVDLGGSGFRGFEFDAARGAFLIVAGHPTGARDFRLVEWDGSGSAVREVHRFAAGEKPEGVAATSIDGKPATVVVFDTSHYMVLP